MKSNVIYVSIALLLALSMAQRAAAALPPEVLQDKYRMMLQQNMQARRFKQALVNIDKFKQAGGEMVPDLLYQQGLALVKTGRSTEAVPVLTEYLEQTGREGKHYQDALAMLIGVESQLPQRQAAQRHDIAPFRDPLNAGGTGPEMVFVEPGCFYLNQPDEKFSEDGSRNRKRVCLEAFAVATHEISFAEYDLFAAASNRKMPSDEGWGRGRRPVINVSYDDAEAYTRWLSKETGKNYRLPTEVEWEYMARSGTDTLYWWGDEPETGRANCDGCGSRWDNIQTAPVGSFSASEWGIYDTAGNAGEWTCSEQSARYDGSEQRCGGELKKDSRRVVRGGSWFLGPKHARSEARGWGIPQAPQNDVGFRVVLLP